MSEWRELTLGDLITVKHGYAFKGEYFAPTGDEIVLTPGNFPVGGGLQFRESKERYYTGPYPEEFRLSPGDLLVVMTDLKQDAPILGSPAFVPSEPPVLHNQRLGLVRLKQAADVDIRYLFYLLLSDHTRSQLRATATGSTVRHTAPERIYRVTARVPPLSEQRTIGSVLGALDDLIENNRRRIDALEQMAQAIYREWFVRFRFPGHEDAAFVDSPLGPIPEGWKLTRLCDRFDVVLGGTPSRRNPSFWTNGNVPWINSSRVNDLRIIEPSELITSEAVSRSNTKVMPRGTTVIAITGATLGQVSMLEIDACANQSVVGVTDVDGELSENIYLAISNKIELIIRHASGGAQQHINKAVVDAVELLLPTGDLEYAFRERVRPLFRSLATLLEENRCLTALRDMLLRRLVIGQIDVSRLDVHAFEAAQA